ncbi:MAG: hypothetical protein R6X17_13750 [Candidatus Competibacteraceae bacterium]
MPIKPEDKARYPANWRDIRAAILERAGDRCEFCGVPDKSWRLPGWEQWTFDPFTADEWSDNGRKATRIVLTIAHLDQTPENNDPANLAALCQRCHLAHDADHNQRKARQTRRRGKALGELFDE